MNGSTSRWLILFGGILAAGCGTTRTTDTTRTATEQLLVSNAVDETISQMNFRVLTGKPVFFDAQYLEGVVDKGYVISSIRQHLLANGCLLQEDRTKATYVVEARAGVVGTDRHEVLFGVPQFSLPTLMPGYPSGMIPEIPLAKKTDKKGVAKLAVFAYNRTTGRPVMQTGIAQTISTGKDLWFLGTGPFQRGTIYDGTQFAGEQIQIPLLTSKDDEDSDESLQPLVPVTQKATWAEPPPAKETKEATVKAPDKPGVVQASHEGDKKAAAVSSEKSPPKPADTEKGTAPPATAAKPAATAPAVGPPAPPGS